MTRPVIYFPYADDQMEFLYGEDFLDQFFLHLLFRGDLAITDGFFFASRSLSDLSLEKVVMPCLQYGALRPVLRVNEYGKFEPAFAEWARKTWALHATSDARSRMRRLDQLLMEKADGYTPMFWPDREVRSVSRSVLRAIEQWEVDDELLRSPDEKGAADLYRETERYRRLIPNATKGDELTRGDLLQEVGEYLSGHLNERPGWTSSKPFESPLDLLKRLPKGERPALAHFFWWISDCYALGQARAFKVDRLFAPSSMFFQNVPLSGLGPVQNDGPDEASIYRRGVVIPRLDRLVHCDLEELLKIRAAEGEEYFRALHSYRTSGGADPSKVTTALEAYAAALRKRFDELEPATLQVWLNELGWLQRPMAAGAVAALIGLAPPPLIAVTATTVFVYQHSSDYLRFEKVTIRPQDTLSFTKRPIQFEGPDGE